GQAAHQRQAETGTLVTARQLALAAVEGLEDLPELACRDPGTVIAHRDVPSAAVVPRAQLDPARRAVAPVLDRVVDQVPEDLHHGVGLKAHRRQAVADATTELESFALDVRAHELRDLAHG